jgi:hypothetical protein
MNEGVTCRGAEYTIVLRVKVRAAVPVDKVERVRCPHLIHIEQQHAITELEQMFDVKEAGQPNPTQAHPTTMSEEAVPPLSCPQRE